MNFLSNLKLYLVLGFRNILRQPRRSLLVISAAAVGMIGVLLTIALMNGLASMWVQGAIESGLGHVQVRPAGFSKSRKSSLVLHATKGLNLEIPGVKAALRFERAGFIRMGSSIQGVTIRGIDSAHEKNISRFADWLVDGEYLHPASERDKNFGIIPCLIGRVNASKLEVEVGDSIILSIAREDGTSRSIRARIQGVFQSIAEPVDKYTVLVQRSDLSKMYNDTIEMASYLVLNSKNRHRADQVKALVQKKTGKAYEVLTYKEMQPSITMLLELSGSTMYILYAIMLSGFAFVLLNAVLMSVFERTRELGILRALGTRPLNIFLQVVFESTLLGTVGCLFGIFLGAFVILIVSHTGFSFAAFARGMEMMGGAGTIVYPSLKFLDIVVGLGTGFLISLLASVYPALRAVRLSPIKAIYDR